MLRIGLTGGLASGKSTVAQMLKDRGAYVLSSDEIARRLMQPGQRVFDLIVKQFGPEVVCEDGTLDRSTLARMAFDEGRIDELNRIVHPATINLQNGIAEELLRQDPSAIAVVESALIFETRYGDGWRERFDRMILVCASDDLKIARYVSRAGAGGEQAVGNQARLQAEAQRRLDQMIPDGDKVAQCDFVLRNDRTLEWLEAQVERVWQQLLAYEQTRAV